MRRERHRPALGARPPRHRRAGADLTQRRRPARPLRHPAQYVVAAFVATSIVGAALLLLPFATQDGRSTSVLTALFTATSAVCVTGLTVVDTPTHWSGFGQGVILGMIQVGGFGIMALTSLLVLTVARRIGVRQRLVAAAESGAYGFGDVRRLLRAVAACSLAAEAVVAALLLVRFWVAHDVGLGRATYLGVFHGVSAFNNAGFALFSDSMAGFRDDPFLLVVIAIAVIVGGLGPPVWFQLARERRASRWSVHAKLTLATTGLLLVTGWAAFAWFEWTNPRTLGGMHVGDSLANSFFHAVMPRSAGFNTLAIDALREPTRLLTEVLMFIGGGSASTAGGIKVTTFAVLGWVMWAEVRGDPDVVVFERRMPLAVQRQALTVALLAVGGVVASTMVLLATTPLARGDVLFESVSALGIVGLSTGITPLLSDVGTSVVVLLMLVGRVGPPTLIAALVLRERDRLYRHPEERPIIG